MLIKANNYSITPRRVIAGTKGSYGIETLEFAFSAEWNGLTKRVTFYPVDGSPVSVLYEDEPINIPAEVTASAGVAQFTLSGMRDGAVLISVTGYLDVFDSNDPVGDPAVQPTPSDVSRIISLMNEAVACADSVREDADNGLFNGRDGHDGQDGEPGPRGADGAPGAPGANGVSPVVTVTSITGGHRIKITDATHPSGQSFDVFDGSLTEIDDEPEEDSENAVSSGGVFEALKGKIDYIGVNELVDSLSDAEGYEDEVVAFFDDYAMKVYKYVDDEWQFLGSYDNVFVCSDGGEIGFCSSEGSYNLFRATSDEVYADESCPVSSRCLYEEFQKRITHFKVKEFVYTVPVEANYSPGDVIAYLYNGEVRILQKRFMSGWDIIGNYTGCLVTDENDDLTFVDYGGIVFKFMEGVDTISANNALAVSSGAVYNALSGKQAKPSLVSEGSAITLADNTEYRLSDVTTLTLTYPQGNFSCWLKVTFAASGTVAVTLPVDTSYIGSVPIFANGETWEISIKDKVVVACKAVSAS